PISLQELLRLISHTCYYHCRFLNFFFISNRLPTKSTLFPSRRSSDLSGTESVSGLKEMRLTIPARDAMPRRCSGIASRAGIVKRSEEHTSELQSRGHLVCRLLLEKKKTLRGMRWISTTPPLLCASPAL